MSAPHNMPLADVVFISEFAAFCRTKGDEAYVYGSCLNCACAQFLRDTNRAKTPGVGGDVWCDLSAPGHPDHPLPEPLRSPNDDCGPLVVGERTFSALATRLEALISDSPSVRVL